METVQPQVAALLEKSIGGWRNAQVISGSREMGRSAGHNTVYIVLNQESRIFIMSQSLQECEMFDEVYSIGLLGGDIVCKDKSVSNAASGAPVAGSFILQQSHVFRDKNEAGMQGDIIEDEEEEVQPHWVFEDREKDITISNGRLAAEDTMSGESLDLFDASCRIPGTFEREGWKFTIPNAEYEEFRLSEEGKRILHQGKLSFRPSSTADGHIELQGTVTTTMYLDAMRVEHLKKPVFAKLDASYNTVLVTIEGEAPIELHRLNPDGDPLQFVRPVFEHLHLQP